jgi:hypothetical protein
VPTIIGILKHAFGPNTSPSSSSSCPYASHLVHTFGYEPMRLGDSEIFDVVVRKQVVSGCNRLQMVVRDIFYQATWRPVKRLQDA